MQRRGPTIPFAVGCMLAALLPAQSRPAASKPGASGLAPELADLQARAAKAGNGEAAIAPLRPEFERFAKQYAGHEEALTAQLWRHIENDRDRKHVMTASQLDERLAILGPYARRVDHNQPACFEPLRRDGVQHFERRRGRRLIVFVVRDEQPAEIGRHHLARCEMTRRERGFARPGYADQRDDAELGNGDLDTHRLNTAI